MNREALLEVSVGITVGLLIVAIAAFRSQKTPSKAVLRRSAMLALITYAVVAIPVFTPSGMTVVGTIALLVIVALALAGSVLARAFATDTAPQVQRYVHALVGTGLAAVLLIATGQTIALVARVDPRVTVIVVGAVAAVLVAGQGLVASSRISSLTMWLLIIPIVIALALGFLLGSVSVVVSPIRIVDGAPYVAILATAVSIFVLGWSDNSLSTMARAARWSPIRVLVGAFVTIALVLVGLLMFLGGAVYAPSMEFFVVPANIDALPGLAGVLLAILTVLFAALVANALAGVAALGTTAAPIVLPIEAASSDHPDELAATTSAFTFASRWVYVAALVAVIIALFDPGAQQVLVATALAAAAVMGAQLSRGERAVGSVAGLIAGVIAVVVLAVVGQLSLGWGSIIATIVVLAVAFVAGRMRASTPDSRAPESVPVGSN